VSGNYSKIFSKEEEKIKEEQGILKFKEVPRKGILSVPMGREKIQGGCLIVTID